MKKIAETEKLIQQSELPFPVQAELNKRYKGSKGLIR